MHAKYNRPQNCQNSTRSKGITTMRHLRQLPPRSESHSSVLLFYVDLEYDYCRGGEALRGWGSRIDVIMWLSLVHTVTE